MGSSVHFENRSPCPNYASADKRYEPRWYEDCALGDVIYRPGNRNVTADALSRNPIPCNDLEKIPEPELMVEILPLDSA